MPENQQMDVSCRLDETPPTDADLERVGWLSMGVNLMLIGLNVVLGLISGSIAVMAEATHNVVDLVSSVGVVIGLRLSRRRSDRFPYGLYKVENVVALIISLFIFIAGYEIAKDALFVVGREVETSWPVLGGVVCSLVIPVLFSHYELRIGRRGNSPSLIADAEEFRMHALSSGAVLVGLVGQSMGLPLDRWAGLFVSFFIFAAGWELTRDAIRALLDASVDPETLNVVRSVLADDPLTAHVTSVVGRNAGRCRFLEAIVVLRTHDLDKAQYARRRMERAVRSLVPHVERILITTEPVDTGHRYCVLPIAKRDDEMAEIFCHAKWFRFARVALDDGRITLEKIRENPCNHMQHGKGIALGRWLVGKHVGVVVSRNELIGKGLHYLLSDAGVETHITTHDQVMRALNDLTGQPSEPVPVDIRSV